MDDHPQDRREQRKKIRTWLFNPFHYVAGGKALAIGVAAVLVAGLAGSVSNSHFDGVLDFHTGAAAPLWMFLVEGLVDWLALSVFLLLGGLVTSRSRVRPLDVLGTQALARFPTVVTALLALLPGYRRFAAHLAATFGGMPADAQVAPGDVVVFAVTALVALLMIVWMVALMYRAYSVSCNVRGGRAIGVFIGALVLAEAASKAIAIVLAAL